MSTFEHGRDGYDFSTSERLHGTGTEGADKLFRGGGLVTPPYPQGLSLKGFRGGKYYDFNKISMATEKDNLEEVDPRYLTTPQGQVTRAGVDHYMGPDGDKLYADTSSQSNQHPLVYEGTDRRGNPYRSLLSGNHRAVAHLLSGKPMKAIVVRGSTSYPDGKVS